MLQRRGVKKKSKEKKKGRGIQINSTCGLRIREQRRIPLRAGVERWPLDTGGKRSVTLHQQRERSWRRWGSEREEEREVENFELEEKCGTISLLPSSDTLISIFISIFLSWNAVRMWLCFHQLIRVKRHCCVCRCQVTVRHTSGIS